VSHLVTLYDVQERKGKPRPYLVRVRVAGTERSKSFATKAQARGYRATLVKADAQGLAFDPATGEPAEWGVPAHVLTVLEALSTHARAKWPRWSGKSRRSHREALMLAAWALTEPGPLEWKEAREALAALLSPAEPFKAVAETEVGHYLLARSLPASQLSRAKAEEVLQRLATAQNGQPVAPNTLKRRRSAWNVALDGLVAADVLSANPLASSQWEAVEVARTVDRDEVPSMDQVRQVLRAMAEQGAAGARVAEFAAVIAFGGLRPSEVAGLDWSDATLPETGWGELRVKGAYSYAGKAFTDDGATGEVRGLKRRRAGTVRKVPIPPELVARLRAMEPGTGPVFLTVRGSRYTPGNLAAQWKPARDGAFGGTTLAHLRLYDLRHVAATVWLGAGLQPADVARRLGHSVDVLQRIYAGWTKADEAPNNALIEAALS
jgi:integrase